jgi:hypothetical protein
MNIGQKVWYVPQRGYGRAAPGREYQIIKIGRKWITLSQSNDGCVWDNIRVEREQDNASQEGYWAFDSRNYTVGRVYVDRQHEIYTNARIAAWEKLAREFRTTCPHHVTLLDIKKMAHIMGVELGESAVDSK